MSDVDGQNELFAGATVSKLEDGDILASLTAWARCLGTSRETLQDRLVTAGVNAKGKRRGYPIYGGRDVISAWISGPDSRIDPDAMPPFQRRAWFQGELDKLKLETERGQLVPFMEVERTLGNLAKLFVLGIDTLIDTVERDVGLTAAQGDCLEAHLDRVRNEIATELGGDVHELPAKRKARKKAKRKAKKKTKKKAKRKAKKKAKKKAKRKAKKKTRRKAVRR